MECIFVESLAPGTAELMVTGDEARHMKVLNLREGAEIMISNGKGLTCTGRVVQCTRIEFLIKIAGFHENFGERNKRLALALAILDSRDRWEFAIEKAVELGVTTIYPLITKYTQKKKTEPERLRSKMIAALKQSKRSVLPELTEPRSIEGLVAEFGKYTSVFLMDENGTPPPQGAGRSDLLIIVGPEGGLAEEEILMLKKSGALPINLGNRRLRAETAAIAALSALSLV